MGHFSSIKGGGVEQSKFWRLCKETPHRGRWIPLTSVLLLMPRPSPLCKVHTFQRPYDIRHNEGSQHKKWI